MLPGLYEAVERTVLKPLHLHDHQLNDGMDASDAPDDSSEWQALSPTDGVGQEGMSITYVAVPSGIAEDDDDDEEGDFDGDGNHASYCTNCTGRLHSDTCSNCGHSADDDEQLFARVASGQHASTAAAATPCLALCFDERMALHDEGKTLPHPERPDRVRAVIARLLASGVADRCMRVPCREASIAELETVHNVELVKFLEAHCQGKTSLPHGAPAPMTSDTYANSHTFLCARLAAGAAAEVATMIVRGQASAGAAIIRPPGHHAESNMAMGFCFFNNAAVAAKAAQAAGARRVLILDWDVHHGNGTQHIFEDDPHVMYMSLHRYDNGTFYPGTGGVHEVGLAAGEGYTINIPWDHKEVSNGDYMAAFHHLLLPIAHQFSPDLILVSAGFDAAEGDPIGECRLSPECFAHMTVLLRSVAPLAVLLEGGYNLSATAQSTEATLRVLLGEQPAPLPGPRGPSFYGTRSIQAALRVQAQYWSCLRAAAAASGWQPSAGYMGVDDTMGLPLTRQQLQRAAMRTQLVGGSAVALPGHASGRICSGRRQPLPGQLRASHQSRKHQIMVALHRRALRTFWKRRRVLIASSLQCSGAVGLDTRCISHK